MNKRTLLFPNLGNLAHFAKEYCSNYLINTSNLTLSAPMNDELVTVAKTVFDASVVATAEKVFSYDPIQMPRPQCIRSV